MIRPPPPDAALPDWRIGALWEAGEITPAWELYEATGYCSCARCCGKWAKWGVTASGRRPVEGVTVAAGPQWRLGACIDIVGIGSRRVQDRGRAITEGKLDIYYASHLDARSWGRQMVVVTRCPK
jgi:3D (Asp-Asp-Asp) domain-containing protein